MKKILSLKTKKENRYFLSCFLACVLALGLCQNSYANGSDAFSISAPSILGTSDVGNLSTATNEGQSFFYSETCTDGGTAMPDDQAFDACPANNGYNSVDFSDIWYQVDLPDGTDEMVLSVTGLGAGEYVAYILHTGAPTASNVVVIPGTYGPCSFFDETKLSIGDSIESLY